MRSTRGGETTSSGASTTAQSVPRYASTSRDTQTPQVNLQSIPSQRLLLTSTVAAAQCRAVHRPEEEEVVRKQDDQMHFLFIPGFFTASGVAGS